MADDGEKVVSFRVAAPGARYKKHAPDDPRPRCKHRHIEIWHKEPIIECTDCGAVVDPYYWIRQRCSAWKEVEDGVRWQIMEAKGELEELKTAIRLLRREYKDEAEKRRTEASLMMLAPRRRFK